jgi:hypothetical protein
VISSDARCVCRSLGEPNFFTLFHSQLVSHEIEAGGKAFSGGKSQNGPVAAGLHFEITLLQVYKVALSAGKAHRDHKHHHVHKFDSNGEISTTTTMAPPPVSFKRFFIDFEGKQLAILLENC